MQKNKKTYDTKYQYLLIIGGNKPETKIFEFKKILRKIKNVILVIIMP